MAVTFRKSLFVWGAAVFSALAADVLAADVFMFELRERLSNLQSLQGEFAQSVYENNQLLYEGNGYFSLARPSNIRWESVSPDPSLLIADGETLWYFNPVIEQVSVFNQSETMQANPLLVILDTDSDHWAQFEISYQAEVWSIRDPRQTGFMDTVQLRFDQNNPSLLTWISIDDGLGQRSDFKLVNTQLNIGIASHVFQMDIPAGVDVDDQRDE